MHMKTEIERHLQMSIIKTYHYYLLSVHKIELCKQTVYRLQNTNYSLFQFK